MSENKICPKCGAVMAENSVYCVCCGYLENVDVSNMEEKQKQGKFKSIGKTFISALIIVIATTVGKFAGKFIAGEFTKDNELKKMDEYIEMSKEYTPGKLTSKKYSSEHFGFKFKIDDSWTMYTKEELEPMTKQVRESAISAGEESLDLDNMDQETIDKWKESVYADTEMGAYYIDDGMIVGEVTVGVFSAYGANEVDELELENDMIKQVESEFGDIASDVTVGEKDICGETYKTLKVKMKEDGLNVIAEMYINMKDGMVCIICCRAIDDSFNTVKRSFFNNISTYN